MCSLEAQSSLRHWFLLFTFKREGLPSYFLVAAFQAQNPDDLSAKEEVALLQFDFFDDEDFARMFFIYSESVGSTFNETEALDVLISLAHRLGRKGEHGIVELDAIRNCLITSFKNWYFATQEEQLTFQNNISGCEMILQLNHDGILLLEELIAVDENHFESWMNDVFHVFLEQLIPLLLENQTEYVVDVLDTFNLINLIMDQCDR